MWTGDFESTYPTQWALNPSAYQNIPSEQVDWATLAQQWIQMKETFPVGQVPPAPPPPNIKADIEAGEAPMDMSKDETPPTLADSTSQDGNNWNNSWNSWQQQWNWNWESSDKAVPGGAPYTYPQPPVAPSFSGDVPPTTFDYNHGASGPVPNKFEQQGYNWSGNQAPFVRNKASSEWRNESRGSSTNRRQHNVKVEEVEPDTLTMLDAAKRKKLPAWIREGLEKMEREKQRKLDLERQLKEREEELIRRKQEEDEAIASGIPLKSKFDTDSESDKEPEEVPAKPRRSRFDASTSSPVLQNTIVAKSASPPPLVKRKTKDEIMQDVMQQMRYILTDILMTVTNEEMQRISEEVLTELRAKAPATQLRKTPALSSLTGKLGLGIYDSDSEDSSDESEDEPTKKNENGVNSDEELRERISRKKQEFAKIERDIEYMVEQQEERDREREQLKEEDDRDNAEHKGQVEPNLTYPGVRLDTKTEEQKTFIEPQMLSSNEESYTPERPVKTEKESSEEHSEDSNNETSSKTDTSSRSSSSSRRRKSKKSKKKKEKKRKRKRSLSRGSDRKKSSVKKSSHRYEERERRRHRYERSTSRSHSRSRSRSRDHYRRHSSESSHKRRHHSYSHSPERSRGKKSSHRRRD